MSDSSRQTSKFLLLKGAISAEFKESLLGSVVNDVVNPTEGFLPDFTLPEDSSPSTKNDYDRLKQTMKGFIIEDARVNTGDGGRIKNEVVLTDLHTERGRENDTRVEGNLTKLLKLHYGSQEDRQFDIKAAKGKRYHLHNAKNQFQRALWSNQYYRDCIDDVIRQKRRDGTLKTLAKNRREFGANKSSHKCEVVLLPMVVGILTCEEVNVTFQDNRSRSTGGGAQVPIDKIVGIETDGALDVGVDLERSTSDISNAAETIPSEVIVALAYDLIAIATNKADPADHNNTSPSPNNNKSDTTNNSNSPPSRSIFDRMLGRHKEFICPECQSVRTSYPEAWIHAEIQTKNSLNINLSGGGSHHQEQIAIDPQATGDVERESAPIELYTDDSNQTVWAENVFPGISPSTTGSTARSYNTTITSRREASDLSSMS